MPIARQTIDQIKAHLNWRDAFLKDEGSVHIRCPMAAQHANGDDSTPSLAIYPDHGHCFACGYHPMDPFTLADDLGTPFPKAAKRLWAAMQRGGPRSNGRQKIDTSPVSEDLWERWYGALGDEHLSWLRSKYAITRSVANASRLGFTGSAIAFPHANWDGDVVQVKFRMYTPKYPDAELRWWGMKNRRAQVPYPWWVSRTLLSSPPAYLMLCEGETDTLSALSNGFDAVGIAEGAKSNLFYAGWEEYWTALRDAGTEVWVAFDNDEAGAEAAAEAVAQLTAFGVTAAVALPPIEGGDVADHFVAERQKAVDTAG